MQFRPWFDAAAGSGQWIAAVAFRSKKFSPAERNYDVREREFMAVVDACSYWRHYLHSEHKFTLRTDHESLKYCQTMPIADKPRIARWMEKMAEFNFDIEHIPGAKNVVADALSRRFDLEEADDAPDSAAPSAAATVTCSARQPAQLNAAHQRRASPARRIPAADSPAEAEQRQKNRDAAEKTEPPVPGLPAPRKNCTIETPSQRCTAQTNAGAHCRQRTAIGQYCWSHLKSLEGLRVKKSEVAGGGRGLFAARSLPRGNAFLTQAI